MKQVNSKFIEFSKPPSFAVYGSAAETIYETDDFRMYQFKIKQCGKTRNHDWKECPYAHRGEKARRRDPRKYDYCAVSCPEFRGGECHRGQWCEFAHGVFEYWLHPTRYRTRACNAGRYCKRKVCFFAHTLEQLRTVNRHKGNCMYRECIYKSDIGEEKSVSVSLLTSPENGMCLESSWEVLEHMKRLRIEDGGDVERCFGGDISDSPNIDWVWDLLQ